MNNTSVFAVSELSFQTYDMQLYWEQYVSPQTQAAAYEFKLVQILSLIIHCKNVLFCAFRNIPV